jgi:hypothetical protein
MHVAFAAKVVFHAQTAACPAVAGVVANQALYCPLVTSVASIQYPGSTRTCFATHRVPVLHSSTPQPS